MYLYIDQEDIKIGQTHREIHIIYESLHGPERHQNWRHTHQGLCAFTLSLVLLLLGTGQFTHIITGYFTSTGLIIRLFPMPLKQPWTVWENISHKSTRTVRINTTKQSSTKTCSYFIGHNITSKTVSSRNISELRRNFC